MNKFILLSALISFSFISAQTEKGTFVISGQTGIGFTSTTVKYESAGQTSDGPKISSFNITPSVGYFIINNLAISLDIDYKTTTTKQQITYFLFTEGIIFQEVLIKQPKLKALKIHLPLYQM